MAEPFTIYKLTILNMLDKAGFPLTNTQLTRFFLDLEYTDYFRVQQVIGDLVDADLILHILLLKYAVVVLSLVHSLWQQIM